jgi:8-oxo-dGTP pyrophosphatase MutT (NUDIX family)
MDKPIERTSSGGVVFNNGKYLAIKWLSHGTVELPKGTVNSGETIKHACIREVFEETGYKVKIIQPLDTVSFIFKWDDGKTYNKTVHYFLLKRIDNKRAHPAREAHEDFVNLWLSYDEIINQLSYDDMRNMVRLAKDKVELAQ